MPDMQERPPSAISLITAGVDAIVMIIGVVAVVLRWVPAYFLVWCGVLAVVVGFNLWAARGSRR
jgi:hypothetical protein